MTFNKKKCKVIIAKGADTLEEQLNNFLDKINTSGNSNIQTQYQIQQEGNLSGDPKHIVLVTWDKEIRF